MKFKKWLTTEQSMIQSKKLKGNKKYPKMNQQGNIKYQNSLDIVQAIPMGKFRAITGCIKCGEESQVNNKLLHLKELEKSEQIKHNISIWPETTKTIAQINGD